MTQTYALYRKLAAMPQGKRMFSIMFARKAPYFSTVRPRVRDVRPNHVELTIANRKPEPPLLRVRDLSAR